MTRISALFALFLVPVIMAAQDTSDVPKISVNTRLVQFDITVHDKNGTAADLTAEDFTVLDQGKPQKIILFSFAFGKPDTQPVQTLPANTFSDLPQYGAATPRSVTIVLLDNLNTLYGSSAQPYESSPYWLEDLALANAKTHLVEYLQNLDPKDRVAIYGLGDSLHVLCDFTSDRDQLLAILKKFEAHSKTNRGVVEPGTTHTPVPGREFNEYSDHTNGQMAAWANQRRMETTMEALQAIAAHVANIPGRKNLVWLTANLPFSGVAMARVLQPAKIAVYPVDVRGLQPRMSMENLRGEMADGDAAGRGDFSLAPTPEPTGLATMRDLADGTGGEAFINTNDLTGAIREAIEDSSVFYTLGFYMQPGALDGKFHELKVQVDRKNLTVRFPKGYFASKDQPATKNQYQNSLITATRSPIESSSIPVQVKLARVEKPLPHCLSVLGSIDIHNVQFEQAGDMRKGAVEVFTIEQDETGKVLNEFSNKMKLQFTEKQYSEYLTTGISFQQYVQPKAGVTTLRILVEDPSTAETGSLIIPLSQVK